MIIIHQPKVGARQGSLALRVLWRKGQLVTYRGVTRLILKRWK